MCLHSRDDDDASDDEGDVESSKVIEMDMWGEMQVVWVLEFVFSGFLKLWVNMLRTDVLNSLVEEMLCLNGTFLVK